MNDFTKGVKAKLKSRSTIYAFLFLALLIGQQMYLAWQAEQEEQSEAPAALDQKP